MVARGSGSEGCGGIPQPFILHAVLLLKLVDAAARHRCSYRLRSIVDSQ